jgi:putative hemolysin
MFSVEQSLSERLPWLAQHPGIRRPLAGVLGKLADEAGFNAILDQAGQFEGFAFVERALDLLGVSCHLDLREREHVPAEGAVLIVANHPLGMVDALALLHMVGSVRSDVRILGNDWLASVPQLRPVLFAVDVFGKGAASRLRDVYRALDNGEAVIVFPAGEVSRMRPHGVRDGRWADGFARLALHRKVPVLPVHIAARNSAMFYGLSMLAKPLSTAMLPREATSPTTRRIGFSVGALVDAAELAQRSDGSTTRAAMLMRRHVYRVGRHRGLIFGGQAALAHPEPADRVAAELLAQGEKLADLADGKQVFLFRGLTDGAVLREVGRLRELTFRKVGEGTNARRDLDAFDAHYEHLLLWDPQALRLVGAYRFGPGGRIIGQRGLRGLYTASLFTY